MCTAAKTCTALNYLTGMTVRSVKWKAIPQFGVYSKSPFLSKVNAASSSKLVDKSRSEYYFEKRLTGAFVTISLVPTTSKSFVGVCTVIIHGWYDSRFQVRCTMRMRACVCVCMCMWCQSLYIYTRTALIMCLLCPVHLPFASKRAYQPLSP